jgi:hypothetical protein
MQLEMQVLKQFGANLEPALEAFFFANQANGA